LQICSPHTRLRYWCPAERYSRTKVSDVGTGLDNAAVTIYLLPL
jgi:hypothetical protein